MRAGHRRAGGGPDVEDDTTGHSSEHGACQRTDSEADDAISAQQRSTEHYPLEHDSLDGAGGAEAEIHEPTYRRAGEYQVAE